MAACATGVRRGPFRCFVTKAKRQRGSAIIIRCIEYARGVLPKLGHPVLDLKHRVFEFFSLFLTKRLENHILYRDTYPCSQLNGSIPGR